MSVKMTGARVPVRSHPADDLGSRSWCYGAKYLDTFGTMEQKSAIGAFGALAQDTRLTVFRLLVQAGPNGLTAGDIAERIGVPPSTLSHHLATLERAGLALSLADPAADLLRHRL